MAYFLWIPRKRVSSHQDIANPLTKFITSQEFQVADFQEGINEVEKLRTDIRVVTDENLNENILPLFYRYYGFLLALEKRVPFGDQEGQCNVMFYWYDGNEKVGKVDIHYEMACVLFNTAAVLSFLGAKQNFETDAGVKKATLYFRSAAATFDQVKEFLEKHPRSASKDLSSDFLSLYASLMLAQAQELFCVLASKSGTMGLDLVAKLYAQGSDYYGVSAEFISSTQVKCPADWPLYVDIKRDLLKAITHYQLAKQTKAEAKYGEELGRLQAAYKLISRATQKLEPPLNPVFDVWVQETKSKVKSALMKAEKDNNLIYHERTVTENLLPQLQKKSMVAVAMPIPNEKFELSTDPWAKLIPFHVRKGIAMWQERKTEFICGISSEVEDVNKKAKTALHAVGLPAALEAIETPNGIPQSLLQKMNAIKSFGGLSALTRQLASLSSMAQECDSILEEAIRLVADEEKDDSEMRAQYGAKWNRTASPVLTKSIYEEKAKHEANLLKAVKSDGYIQTLVQQNGPGFDLLGGDEQAVLSALPSAETPASGIPIQTLKKLLKDLDDLIFNREQIFSKFQEDVKAKEVSDELIQMKDFEFDAFFVEELKKFNDPVTKIRDTFTPQAPILASIQEEIKKIHQHQHQNPKLLEREKIISEMEAVYANFQQIRDHLTEGTHFYTNFQNLLRTFRSNCSDHVFSRKTEKQDLLREIQARTVAPIVTTSQQPTPQPQVYGSSVLGGSSGIQQQTVWTQPQQKTQQPPSYVAHPQPVPYTVPTYGQPQVYQQAPGYLQNVPQYHTPQQPYVVAAAPPAYHVQQGAPPAYHMQPQQAPPPAYGQPKPSVFGTDPYGLNNQQRRF